MESQGALRAQTTAWTLEHKLGEGDAGEVYLVSSVKDGRQAILKRPRASAFHAEVLRQASQIALEGRILQALKGFRVKLQDSYLTVPQLIDRAKPELENSAEYFIIIEKAPGVDLDFLVKLNHMNEADLERYSQSLSSKAYHFVQHIQAQKKVPELIFLKCIEAVIVLFEEIHHYPVDLEGVEREGILWNDVKPEHIFWDPESLQCTIIDWGNAQFLEMDGTTRDRLHSASDDHLQFLDSIGKFLQNSLPALYEHLHWAERINTPETCLQEVRAVCEMVEQQIALQREPVLELRERETDLLNSSKPGIRHIKKLDRLQQDIYAAGELPAVEGAGIFAAQLAKELVAKENLADFAWVSEWANNLPLEDRRQWQLFSTLAKIGISSAGEGAPAFLAAIHACMHGEPGDILWDLLREMDAVSFPDWYPALSEQIRAVQLDLDPAMLTPFQSALEFTAALEGNLRPAGEFSAERFAYFERTTTFIGTNEKSRKMVNWLERLKTEILPRWQQLEPDPPHAGLAYSDLRLLIQEMEAAFPDAGQALARSIYQAEAQNRIVLDAWERKDFDFARRVLRRLLVWDPERLRVILAGKLMEETPTWLEKLTQGPLEPESAQDFATRHEVFARELRNRVGAAPWLERLLQAFKSLRQGRSISGVLADDAEIAAEMPWMRTGTIAGQPDEYEHVEQTYLKNDFPSVYDLERKVKNNITVQLFKGCVESKLGPEGDILLGEPLDTWRPEAQGSSARVFLGFVRSGEESLKQRAIKIMRPNQRDYALPLFEEEVRILRIMQDVQGVTPFLEFGFWMPENHHGVEDILDAPPEGQKGEIVRYGWDHADAYLGEIRERSLEGWLPYIVMEKKNHEANLLSLCDGGYTQGNLLPVKLGLLIAIQICDILAQAHRNNILYRDHKILHYYWQPVYNGVFVIDWNVAKIFDRELTESEKHFDLVQFGARALHHILSGRPAPGALPLGPTRPDEIEQASSHYNVAWSFDDRRLNEQVKEVVQRTLSGVYTRAETLQQDLVQVFYNTRDE